MLFLLSLNNIMFNCFIRLPCLPYCTWIHCL